MLNIFKKNKPNKNEENYTLLTKTTSLLIHAAKIDENYSSKEKEIIKKTLIKLGAEQSKIDEIILNAENNEEKSNQILDFTKEIKNTNKDYKIKVIEALWNIIYSNNESDMYESNLMRRLSGLLYIDNKSMGDIKEKVRKSFSK